ncbi:MAG: hypothetical protein GY842_16460 [bacterium]|nr:hypothetical protein [bacterium]
MIRRPIITLTILSAFAVPVAADPVDLKPKLEPGMELHYLLTSGEEAVRTFQTEEGQPPRKIPSTGQREVGMRLRCVGKNADGSATLEWTLLYLSVTAEGAQPMSFDSRDPAQMDSPEGMILSQIVSAPATVTVDANGHLTEYKDPASIGGGPIREFMRELLSDDAFKQLGFLVTRAAPEDSTVGTTWTEVVPEDLDYGLGTMLITSNHKVAEIDDSAKTAEIETQGKLAMKAPEPPKEGSPPPSASMTIDEGSFTRKNQWDWAAGQLVSAKGGSTFVGTAAGSWGSMHIEKKTHSAFTRVTPDALKQAMQKPAPKKPDVPASPDSAKPAKETEG